MNDAPVLASVSDVSFDEDGSGSTSLSGSDVDGDALTYDITGGSDITASLSGSDVSFSAPANYNGSEEFTVSVTDGTETDSQSITVTVNAVNDAPVATAGLSGTTDEDQSTVVTLSGLDIDGDNLTFTVGSATNGTLEISGSLVTYTPDANYNGSDSFDFTVSDGEYSSTETVTLTVSAVNDAPVLAAVSNVSFDEDGSGSTSLSGSDVDGDALTYDITGGSDITASLSGSDVSFSAPANYNGSEEFTVSVTDGTETDSQSITVTVNAVNDAPVATAGLSGTTDEDQNIVINLSGVDIDGDALVFSLGSDAINGTVIVNGSIATYTPNANYNGDDSFDFTVSDGEYSSTESVTLTVSAVNDAPVLAVVSDVSFDEDGTGFRSLSASDIDGDDLK